MPRLPRLTFLVRFALATFVAAVVAAFVLASVLEALHRRAVERDQIAAAVARIDTMLGPPVRQISRAGYDRRADEELNALLRDARLAEFVIGFRVYDYMGNVIFPRDAPPAKAIVAKVLQGDDFIEVNEGDRHVAYTPLVVGGARGVYVIAVDFSRGQLDAQFRGEHRVVIGATLVVTLLIFGSLAVVAAGASRELERRRREAEHTLVQTLSIMSDAIDLRDPYTAGHSRRVAEYSGKLAERLGLRDPDLTTVQNGALLHDLGKIGIPDAVLFKPGHLDSEERKIIGRHPVIGAEMLSRVPTVAVIVPCVLHHHERVDGSGYPDHLIGDAIPFGARIIAVADAFDAMTTDRPYRRGLELEAAVDELIRGIGKQFDGRCVDAFVGLVREGAIVPPPRRSESEAIVFGARAAHEAAALPSA